MYNFVLSLKKIKRILLLLLCTNQIMFSMDHQELSVHDRRIKPFYSHNYFDFSKKPKDIVSLKVIIAPDERSILISKKNGIVSHLVLEADAKEEYLMQLPHVKHVPMIAAVNREGSLLVVSAGNYSNDEHKNVSECCIWHNGFLRMKQFGDHLQAIALDEKGDLLIMANQGLDISVFDLNTNKVNSRPIYLKNKDHIIDIAVSPQGPLVFVGKTNGMGLMSCQDISDVGYIRQHIPLVEDIKSVYFPTQKEMIFITRDNVVKMLDIYDVMNNREDNIKPTVLFETDLGTSLHNKISIDEGNCNSVALWSSGKSAADWLQNQIVIRKRNQDTIEEHALEMPMFCETYEYKSKQDRLKRSKNHLSQVALRGDSVVAICADGRLHWWITTECYDNQDSKKEMPFEQKYKHNVPHIVQSSLAETGEEAVVEQPKQKKVSPRFLSLIKLSNQESPRRAGYEFKGRKNSAGKRSRLLVSSDDDSGQLSPNRGQLSPSRLSPKRVSRLTDEDGNEKSLDVSPRVSRLVIDENGNDKLFDLKTIHDNADFKLEAYFVEHVQESKNLDK